MKISLHYYDVTTALMETLHPSYNKSPAFQQHTNNFFGRQGYLHSSSIVCKKLGLVPALADGSHCVPTNSVFWHRVVDRGQWHLGKKDTRAQTIQKSKRYGKLHHFVLIS